MSRPDRKNDNNRTGRRRASETRHSPVAGVSRADQPARKDFLPVCRADMDRLGWDCLDILLVTGDAYVDHPSFGAALLGRWLLDHGYRVGVIAQPRWDSTDDITAMGRPRLFAGVTAGSLDSMLAHYTAFRKKRSDDAYTPGGCAGGGAGVAGGRPNRASIVYSSLVKQAFKGLPVVLGGIEASLRRISHFDFWTDKLRRSILLDAKATLLLYGMSERSILEIAEYFDRQQDNAVQVSENGPSPLASVRGCVFLGTRKDIPHNAEIVKLPAHDVMMADPASLMTATLDMERQVHQGRAWAVQPVDEGLLIITPPAKTLSTQELDRLYSLPFTRRSHPSYRQPVPAEEMIRFSITSHRGCAGGCSFCSLALHQGRKIRSRSEQSIADEIARMSNDDRWRGSISDIGGPSANMWGASCAADPSKCQRSSCMHPEICRHFVAPQGELAAMLLRLSKQPGVKHLRVASGVRFDLAMQSESYSRSLVEHFVGGQLKLAPEHVSDSVLKSMRKPPVRSFESFIDFFEKLSGKIGKKQFIIPYLMTAFPGCTERDMNRLADWLRRRNWRPQQFQCFIPLPGTVAAAMFFAGVDVSGEAIEIPRSDAARLKQHGILSSGATDSPAFGKGRGHKNASGHKKSHGHSGGKSRGRAVKRRRG